MTVTEVCEIIGVSLLGVGALASCGVWLLGVGQKLGKIVSATETSAEELGRLTTQMATVENHLEEHSQQLVDLRTDMTDLQRHWPFRRSRHSQPHDYPGPLDAFVSHGRGDEDESSED